jgi:SAM-dependent methyltransferase
MTLRSSPKASEKKAKEPSSYYLDAALYEKTFAHRQEDIAFYLRLAEECGGPVLEYGAGAGRVTLGLARAGVSVVAVDSSPAMLTLLRERLGACPKEEQARVKIVRADMRKKGGLGKFPLVLATFNVVGHLPKFEDMALWLARVKEHLSPGGEVVFDVPLPAAEELGSDPEDVFPAPRFKHPVTGAWIRQTERFEYDAVSQMLRVESEFRVEGERDPLVVPLNLRQWFPRELEALMTYEGFTDIRLCADYTDEPALDEVDMLVVRARYGAAKTPRIRGK